MDKNTIKSEREQKLQHVVELENKLNEIQDIDVLLERILTEARRIVNADAGSIYVVNGDKLQIKYAQNDTQLKELPAGEKLPYSFFSFPISDTSVAGYVARTGKSLNIPDVYKLDGTMPFSFNLQSDIITNYKTRSMYTLPLKMANGVLLGVLQIINAQDMDGNLVPFDGDAELFINHFATNAVQALQHAYNTHNMNKRMLKLAEFRDPKETYVHVERVSAIAVEIYDRWAYYHNIPENEQHTYRDNLKIAAKFHDIGKVGISDVILKKTYPRFDDNERAVMKGHTCLGGMLFANPDGPLDQMEMEVALHHHEWYDGSDRGYPGHFDPDNVCTVVDKRNLSAEEIKDLNICAKYEVGGPVKVFTPMKGSDIPLSARIVAVADVFDALSHKRCYKEAWTLDDAFAAIQEGSGTQFDPEVVLAFMKVRERVCSILMSMPDEE